MAKKSFYAVKAGNQTGVFTSWAECEAAVKGFPNADYKGFVTEGEAIAYLSGEDIYMKQISEDLSNGYVVAYTDGSYDEKSNQYAYGVCIFSPDGNTVDLCSKGNYEPFTPSRNIAGEVFGVLTALDWALSNEYDKIRIYHDLEGISKWASGEYKADSAIAQFYVSRLKDRFDGYISYEFCKVAGHSNNPYNNKADLLASGALKGERKMIEGANSFTISNFSKEDFDAIVHLIEEGNEDVIITRKSILGGEQIKISIGRKSTIAKMYDNKKLLVQGKPNVAFNVILTYISELLGEKKAVPLIKQAFRMSIDTKIVDSNYENLCPNIPESYHANIKTLIRQAIINLSGYFEAEEYGQYAYPALRALEGHIKYLFNKHGVTIGRSFAQFDGDTINGYTLQPNITMPAPDNTNIEECYNYFVKNRHKIFHFGDVIGTTDNTMLLTTKEEADEIIRDALRLINRTVY